MNKGQPKLFNVLTELPWWVSVLIACTVYIGLSFVLQNIQTGNQILEMVKGKGTIIASFLVFLLLIPLPFAYFRSRTKRQELSLQSSIDSLKALPSKALEELVAEAYRRQEYNVAENGFGSESGINMRLVRSDSVTLVHCKQWGSKNVGVCVVREMFSILTKQRAAKVIVISCNGFTHDAQEFAENKPIELIGGEKLLELLGDMQIVPNIQQVKNVNEALCLKSDNTLVERQKNHGLNACD